MEKYQPIAINRKQDKNNREVIKMSETFKYKVSSERLSEDSFKVKKYFEELPLHDASYKFKFVSHSLPLAMNMQREKRFRERGWICLGCNGQPPPVQLGAPHPWTHPPQTNSLESPHMRKKVMSSIVGLIQT